MRVRSVPHDDVEVSTSPAEALLERLRRGDRQAQAEFFDTHVELVERLLLRILGPDSELEDLVQESFLEALRSVHRYRGDAGGLRAWLRAVAVRTACKRLRRRTVRRRLLLRPTEEIVAFPGSADPSTQAALHCAQELIARLPAKERIVFALRFVEGLELKTVAEATNQSVATVKRRLTQARKHFETAAKREVLLQEWLDGVAEA